MTRLCPRLAGIAALVVFSASSAACSAQDVEPDRRVAEVRLAEDTHGLHGTRIRGDVRLPDEPFTDTSGRTVVPSKHAEAPVTLLFFGYTHCLDICHVVLANIATALRGADAQVRQRVQLMFVTTDPERDTPRVVRDYLDRFDRDFVGLVAPVPTVRAAAASVHIAYEGKHHVHEGGYEVMHGTQVTGFVDGRARVLWRADTPVRHLRADLTKLAGAS